MPEDVSGYRPRKEKTPAWLWLLLGCGGVTVLAVVGVFLLGIITVGDARSRAQEVYCRSNLRQIGLACLMYAEENDQKFPPNLQVLMPNHIDSPKIFVCRGRPGGAYKYLPGRTADSSPKTIIAFESPSSHGGSKFNVLFADAHVEAWQVSRLGEFEDLIAAQSEELRKAAEAPKRP